MPPTPQKKVNFADDLIARTANALPPGKVRSGLEHPGSDIHSMAHAIATMIELAQQAPGPMSAKALAAQAAEAAAAASPAKP